MDMLMVVCDNCGGRSAVCGLYPRKGMTREDLLERIQTRGKATLACQHCGKVTTLRLKSPSAVEAKT